MLTDPKDELCLFVDGIRHAAESIRTAVIGWYPRPRAGFGPDAMELCAELYACAGRIESRLRDYAAVEAAQVSAIRSVTVSGEQGCDAEDSTSAESVIAVPPIGTYIMGTNAAAPARRVDLLVQALGIVERVIARVDADDSHLPARAESCNLHQLRERLRDVADTAARG